MCESKWHNSCQLAINVVVYYPLLGTYDTFFRVAVLSERWNTEAMEELRSNFFAVGS